MAQDLAFDTAMTVVYGEPETIAPGLLRLVAPNPGPLTFKGTNTYLLTAGIEGAMGDQTVAVIDPGPEIPAHRAAILKAAGSRSITHIFITHAHRDHVDGAAALVMATGAATYGFGRLSAAQNSSLASAQKKPVGSDFINYAFTPTHRLRDGDRVAAQGWEIEAIYTPGHAPDHLCFAVVGTDILLSGDHVMAWNTTVVAPPEGRMADYLASLELLLTRQENVYLPGHGGPVTDASRTVKAYLLHRRWREQAISDAVRNGARTIPDIVRMVYPTLAPHLIMAASLSVQAHVEHLIDRGLMACDGPLSFDRPLSV